MGGVVPDEESQGSSFNVLSKDLRPKYPKGGTSMFSRLEDQGRVCELGTAPCLSTLYLPGIIASD